jgi:hypothetical protein
LRHVNGFGVWKEMSHLGKAIFNVKNGIQVLSEREVSDEVQRNMCPGWKRAEETIWLVLRGYQDLA